MDLLKVGPPFSNVVCRIPISINKPSSKKFTLEDVFPTSSTFKSGISRNYNYAIPKNMENEYMSINTNQYNNNTSGYFYNENIDNLKLLTRYKWYFAEKNISWDDNKACNGFYGDLSGNFKALLPSGFHNNNLLITNFPANAIINHSKDGIHSPARDYLNHVEGLNYDMQNSMLKYCRNVFYYYNQIFRSEQQFISRYGNK